jgi:protein TonB
VLRGHPLLDEAALDAVRRWAYVPTLLNGVPVPVIMTVTVNFRLE